jgi:uncharacterized protein involved in exopolysaccharide biosynthesis
MLEMNSRVRTERGSKGLTLRDIATPLFRRKRLLIVVFLFVFAMAVSLGLLCFHKYESQMTILVSRERLDPVVTAGATNRIGEPPPLSDREVNSDAELLKTHDLLEQVVLANGLQNPHGGRFLNFFRRRQTQEDRVAAAVQALVSQIQVETAPQTNLIKVTYRSPDRDLAYGVLKSLGNLYLEKHAAIHRPPGSNQFLTQQAQHYKEALEDAQAAIRAFGQPQDVAGPNNEGAELAWQLYETVAGSHVIEQAIAADEQRIQVDQEQMKLTPQTSLTDRAPDFDSLQKNLAKDQADLETQQASLAANERRMEAMQSQLVKLRSQPLDEAGVAREANAREQGYVQYLSQREQDRASGGLDRTRTESVAIAVPPAIPLRPGYSPALIILIAFAAAALISLLMVYITDHYDPSFHTPAEVIDFLGVPVVVALPKRTA